MTPTVPEPIVLGVLGSGKGSNFQAILDAIDDGSLDLKIGLVISDNPDAGILRIAASRGIPAAHIPPATSSAKLDEATEHSVTSALQKAGVNLVVLAGFMRILRGPLLDAYPGRIINIHPSLLPKHPGREAWKQALEAGDTVTGCTVHYVTREVDAGPVIAQGEVDIYPGDTPESLHSRIQRAEHLLLPMVLGSFARGEIPLPAQRAGS